MKPGVSKGIESDIKKFLLNKVRRTRDFGGGQ